MKTALVLGGSGFIGNHLVKRLKQKGYWVRAVDQKYPEFSKSEADDLVIGDLRNFEFCSTILFSPKQKVIEKCEFAFDEVYQLAADMGGAGYIFSGENDANVMHNSAQINLNVVYLASLFGVKKTFYSSSACMYPEHNQLDPDNPNCEESSAYPANPDSEYGWEKLFSERLYMAYHRNYGLNVRIARFHNIFGPESCYNNGKEKAPAAVCRKVAELSDDKNLEIWGDGKQTRSFLYIDECLEAVERLMKSDFMGPVNIGSDEMVTINQLAETVLEISGKKGKIVNVPSNAIGVKGRNSDNRLIQEKLGWSPDYPLKKGMEKLYWWVHSQVHQSNVPVIY